MATGPSSPSPSLPGAAISRAYSIVGAAALVGLVRRAIEAEPRARLEYVELVDESTLIGTDRADDRSVLLTAAWFGDVRLIDNLPLGDR